MIDNGNIYVFCDTVDAKQGGCLRGAGHNGDHIWSRPLSPVLMADALRSDVERKRETWDALTPDNRFYIVTSLEARLAASDALVEQMKEERDHERHEKETVAEAAKAHADWLRAEVERLKAENARAVDSLAWHQRQLTDVEQRRDDLEASRDALRSAIGTVEQEMRAALSALLAMPLTPLTTAARVDIAKWIDALAALQKDL